MVREFYAAIDDDVADPDSDDYGKIILRGRHYNFTPEAINTFYGITTSHTKDMEMTGTVELSIVKELTGGKLKKWDKRFASTNLTWKYAVLHKIAVVNWCPSSNTTILTREQAFLIYRLGIGLPVNFGQLVFDALMKNALAEDAPIMFPSLIYQLLRAQKLPGNASGEMYEETKKLTFSRTFLTSSRVQDLPYVPEVESEHEEDSLDADIDQVYEEMTNKEEASISKTTEAKQVLSSLPKWILQAEELVQALKDAQNALKQLLPDE